MDALLIAPADLALLTAIMALATVVQMSIGIGLSLVMIPLLALVDPRLVPGPAVLAAFVVMGGMVRGNRALIDRVEIGWGAVGLTLGTAAGVALLFVIDPAQLPRLFGALILIAVALSLSGLKLTLRPRDIAGASVVSGVMGGMSGIHGPLIGLVYAGQDPAKVRATLGLYWIVAYALLIAMHVGAGRVGAADLARAVWLVPGILVGMALSPHVARLIDRERMRLLLYAVSTVSGVALLVR